MATDIVMEFNDVFMEQMGSLIAGRMKLSEQQVSFKNAKTGKLEHISRDDIAAVEWLRVANQPAVKFTQKDLLSFRFGGFKDTDFDKVKTFVSQNWNQELDSSDPCVKGWNYGKAKFEGSSLNFKTEGKSVFEVPLKNVNQCTAQKSEVVMEFHQNEDCPVSLMEMRFHVPVDPDDENATDPVEDFRQAVLRYAGIVEDDSSRKPLITFKDIFCNTPRGKYDFNIYATHIALHGKTYDYKIPANTILRMFLLQHRDGNRMFFVISVDPPLRQGQTRYPYLVLEFSKDEEVEAELNMTEEQIQEKFNGKLQREMSGPTYEIFCRVLRTLLKQKITVPGSFVGHSGTPAIQCAYKQANGFLYPLERGFIFVHKPPMYLRFEEISAVNFARSDHSTKSFDFEVETKTGIMFPFSGIEKEEYTKLFDFVSKKNVSIRNAGKSGPSSKKMMDGGFSDSDEERDPYKERLKKEAKAREDEALGPESDSEDEDSDYNPEMDLAVQKKKKEELRAKGALSSSDDTGSDSEPDLEYDSEAGSTSASAATEEGSSDASSNASEDTPKKKKPASLSSSDDTGSDTEPDLEYDSEAGSTSASAATEEGSSDASSNVSEDTPKKKKSASERKPREKKEGGGKKNKKKKDPNAPKKASTGFMIWLNTNRADIKEEGMGVTDVAKKAGELWKAMEDKSEWDQKAKEEKERYAKEMEEYLKNKPDSEPEDSDSKSNDSPTKTAKKASSKSKSKAPTISPKKNVKSKEYISDSSDSDSDAKTKKTPAPAAAAKSSDDDDDLPPPTKKEPDSDSDDAPLKSSKKKSESDASMSSGAEKKPAKEAKKTGKKTVAKKKNESSSDSDSD